ncbi:MAG TPA: hypothetical protein PLF71_02610 [bacterium]|nr:MAG: hypothetical protein BWY14_00016 [Parcubacteria group bacterium ADurb.Bin192]HPN14984.1 hypothetical protein [bacterium]
MKYKYLFVLAAACLFATQAQAATLSPGDLIKASGPAVYYYSQEGKRLVFPNENTYKTWYTDFSTVKTITDAELAAITMGGNVTYKPGVRLVKIVSDSKVYAIAAGGVLRHVATEEIARNLYGADWNTKVDDIPVGFFSNYSIGSSILNSTDYSPSASTAQAVSIDTDRAAKTTPPVCTTCGSEPVTPTTTQETIQIALSASQNTIKINDVITFTASAQYSASIKEIRIYFDNNLVTACQNANVCSGDFAMPSVLDKETYQVKTEVTALDTTKETKTLDLARASTTEPDSEVTISVDREVIEPGQTTGITVQADETVDVKEIIIYVDDVAKKGCNYLGRSCKWSQIFDGPLGTEFNTYGLVTSVSGVTYRTQTKTITLAANSIPYVTIETGKTYILKGESMEAVVSASDEDGIQSIEILDSQKNVLKTCSGAAPCTLSTGPWVTEGMVTLWGRATDVPGSSNEQSIQFEVR